MKIRPASTCLQILIKTSISSIVRTFTETGL